MSPDLMKIFDGYVRNYHTLNLTNYHGKRSFTMAEIEYFSRLGSMLGYWTFTEDTLDGYVNPMDLTWWDNPVENENGEEEWSDFILHLERENYYDKDEETLKKLFQNNSEYKPQNVIGIISVPNKKGSKNCLKLPKRYVRCPTPCLFLE